MIPRDLPGGAARTGCMGRARLVCHSDAGSTVLDRCRKPATTRHRPTVQILGAISALMVVSPGVAACGGSATLRAGPSPEPARAIVAAAIPPVGCSGWRAAPGPLPHERRGYPAGALAPALGIDSARILIPVAGGLGGCQSADGVRALPGSALPFLGIACGRANSIACTRVGIGVKLDRPATLVVVQVAGAVVALDPPTPGSDLWLGYLQRANLRRGPLAVRIPAGQDFWSGTPEVFARARATAFLPRGGVATVSGVVQLHPGFG
jgi:hypothetical protein